MRRATVEPGWEKGSGRMTFLHRYSISRPVPVLVVAALVVLAVAPGALRLKLRTDGYALVPADRPEVIFDRAVRDEFFTEDVIVVLIQSSHAGGIYTAETLRLVQQLTHEFQGIEGVREYDVSSLETEHSHRVKQGTLDFRRFLEPLPEKPADLARLRGDLERIELYTGTIVSDDGTATAIFVGVPAGADRTELYGQVQDIIAAHLPRPEQIRVIGATVAEALLGIHILEDLGVPRPLLGVREAAGDSGGAWHWPGSLYELRLLVGRHVGLVPIAIFVMAVVFVISFRSPTAAMLPLIEVGACLAAVFGLMGWLGVPIYLTIAVMPVILTAIGVADEVHVFSRYLHELRTRPEVGHLEALGVTMEEMWVPVVKTSVTTAVGFLSFALSPLGPVRAFGIFTAVGIIFCMFWSLSVVPAMLALVSPRRFVGRAPQAGNRMPLGARLFARVGSAVGRGRYFVAAAALAAMVAAPFGVARVNIQDSWINGFAPDSDFYRATQDFNRQFLGSHLLLLRVETDHRVFKGQVSAADIDHRQVVLPGDLLDDPQALVGHYIFLLTEQGVQRAAAGGEHRPPRRARGAWGAQISAAARQGQRLVVSTERRGGSPVVFLRPKPEDMLHYQIRIEPLTDPKVIRRIGDLEAFIEDQRHLTVGGVIGTASYLATTNHMSRGLKEGTYLIPGKPDKVRWLWSQYKRIRGPERLQQIVDPDYACSLVTVFLKNANFVDVGALMEAIREYEAQHLAPHGITLGFAGDVAVSQTLIRAIVETQVWSLGGSLFGILLVTTLMSRVGGGASTGESLRWGLLCVLPCALAVLINFAVMGWTGMPLGVATSMFAGMTLGIGVDFAIHLLERYRLARRRGLDPAEAVTDAVTITGPAVFIDALAVALGFGILTLSQVPANARLGALVVLSIAGCLAATLLLLPALLRLWPPRMRPSA